MKIEYAKEADLAYFVRCGIMVKEYEESCGNDTYADPDTFIEEYSRYIVGMSRNPSAHLLVAREDDKVVGCLIGVISDVERFFKDDAWGHMHFIWVDEPYREKDTSRLLGLKFEEIMRENDCSYLVGIMNAKNQGVIDILKEYGFETTHYKMARRLYHGMEEQLYPSKRTGQ